MWFFVHGIVYSLFVAVLLLNFTMNEDDKLPAQKQAYDAHQGKKVNATAHSIAGTLAKTNLDHTNDELADTHKLTDMLRGEASRQNTEKRLYSEKSLMVFYLNNPIR